MKNHKRGPAKGLGAMLLSAMLLGLLAVNALAAPAAVSVTAQLSPNFTILVNGAAQDFYNAQGQEVHPIVYNGTTYLPLRAIGELMGKNVNWDQSTLTVSLSGVRATGKVTGVPDAAAVQQQITAQIRPDFTIVLDNTPRAFTDSSGAAVYPLLYNGTTYLPLRAISSLMGYEVGWDAVTKTVSLTAAAGSLVTDADSFNQTPGTAGTTPGTAGTTPGQQPGVNSGTLLTVEAAKAKALAHAGLTVSQVTFVKEKLDWENGRQVYEIEFYTADYKEYDYEIDAYTGAVVSFDYDAEDYSRPVAGNGGVSGGSYIGEEKARSIVLAKVPGATAANIVKLKLDYDDGRWEYEGEILYNGMEYEFELDAYTGSVLSWEVDRW